MHDLKNAYESEAKLLEELCTCLAQERECLVEGQIGKLWALREKKEKICEQLETQERIIREQIEGSAGGKERSRPRWLVSYRKRVRHLKLQAVSLSSENMKIVQDVLGFIDGLIGAIATPGEQTDRYGRKSNMISYPRIIFREA